MANEIRDITIVGGGPTGLFAAFYAGMRGSSCRIIDSLPELGGQLTTLCPEKYIFDVGGLAKVLGKDLVKNQIEQGLQFNPEVILDEQVQEVIRKDDHFEMRCAHGNYLTKSIVIAGGKGAFEPMPLKAPRYETLLRRGVECTP